MSYKVVKNAQGVVIAYGPDNDNYAPHIKVGETLSVETNAPADPNPELTQWQADMQALDAEGVTRPIEDIIDSMDAEQLARLDPFLRDVHTRKKAKRNQKPA